MVELDYSGELTDRPDHGSWLHIINTLLRLFLTDEIVRDADDGVAETTQSYRRMKQNSLRAC